jgi:hypothetical protein
MEQMIFDEKNGLWYELVGDYYIPCLTVPEQESELLGHWGQQHRSYLLEHNDGVYTGLLLSGKLDRYLHQLDEQAENMFLRLVKQLAEKEGATEQLKADDQMLWVQMMNIICSRVTDIINYRYNLQLTENAALSLKPLCRRHQFIPT